MDMDKKRELARKLKNDPAFFIEYTMTLKGKPFTFDGHEPNKQIYYDEHPRIIVVAGRQVAKTETAKNLVSVNLFQRAHHTLLYATPTDEQTQRFVRDRLKPALRQSRGGILDKAVDKERDLISTIRMKNDALGYFGSAYGQGDGLRGISSDMVFFDEVQDISQDAIENTIKSASHSQIYNEETEMRGRFWFFGTPKQAGTYYNKMWDMSDQKKWHVTCVECDYEQQVTMNNIKERGEGKSGYFFACKECGCELDRSKGRWIPTRPENKAFSGYHYTQLVFEHNTATSIMYDYETMSAERFANEVLGEFYTGSKKPITRDIFLNNTNNAIDMEFQSVEPTYMGIDWGSGTTSKTIVTIGRMIDGKFRIIYAEEIKEQDYQKKLSYIEAMMHRYSVARLVLDIGYGTYENQYLYERYGKMIIALRYTSFDSNPKKRKKDGQNILMLDRTHVMDIIVDMFHKHKFEFPYLNAQYWETFIDHYTAIEVDYKVLPSGQGKKLYTHQTPDDAFHSLLYAYIAHREANNTFEFDYNERSVTEFDILDKGMDDLPKWWD